MIQIIFMYNFINVFLPLDVHTDLKMWTLVTFLEKYDYHTPVPFTKLHWI